MKAWYCADCTAVVELDPHARCAVCGSDALTRAKAERRTEWPAGEADVTPAQQRVGGSVSWDERL